MRREGGRRVGSQSIYEKRRWDKSKPLTADSSRICAFICSSSLNPTHGGTVLSAGGRGVAGEGGKHQGNSDRLGQAGMYHTG